MPEDWFVSVAISRSQPAAEAAAARLKAAGLEAHLREADPTGEPGAALDVVVMVPSSQAAVAHALLQEAAAPEAAENRELALGESIPDEEVPPEAVAAGLAQIRRRRLMMWFWFFSYLPVALVVSMKGPETSAPIVALVWMTAYLVSGALVASTRCPRCRRRFCADGRRWNPYTQRCLNCQLPLGVTQQPADAGR